MAKYEFPWHTMYADWKAGQKSINHLSKEYGVSRPAIVKHWAKEGVERDLDESIKDRAESLVASSLVAPLVACETTHFEGGATNPTDSDIIEANAHQQAEIMIGERRDVTFARKISKLLMIKLEDQIVNIDDYETLAEILQTADEKGSDKLNDAYRKVISFSSQVDNLKKLAEALRILVDVERKVYKIDEIKAEGTVEDFLRMNKPA